MKKALMIIGGIVVVVAVIIFIVFQFASDASNKLICTSNEGSITIMYSDKTIVGYTASNMDFDMDGQTKIAEEMGIKAYIDEFNAWFSNNTTGSCVIEEK